VVVQVNADGTPDRHVKGCAVVGEQMLALVLVEDFSRVLLGRAVPTLASDLAAPGRGLRAHVGEIHEGAALPEATLHVRDESLGVGFIARMTHAGRIDQKAARLAVFEKAARQPRLQCIGAGDRGRKVIDDQSFGDALEESPRGLQPANDLLERLMQQRPDERVPTEGSTTANAQTV
jgi:hypothetical protein